MHADPGQRPLGLQFLEADRPLRQRCRVRGHDHHRVPDRLHDAGLVGERGLDALDEALDGVQRVLLAGLLGQPGVAGEVGEGDRHAQATEVQVGRVLRITLQVTDNVLLDEVGEEALVQVVHDRSRQRQQVAREVLHLLGHLQPGNAVADQGLVHVEMKEPDLGVGDRPQRLAVDAHELQEGDGRQPGIDDRRDVAQQLQVVLGDGLELHLGDAHGRPDTLDHRRLEARLPRCLREGVRPVGAREHVLHVAEGQATALGRLAQGLQRIPAVAQPGDDAGVGHRRRRPAVVAQGDDLVAHPAAQGRGLDVDLRRNLRERGELSHGEKTAESPFRRPRRTRAMRPASLVGGVRLTGDALPGPEPRLPDLLVPSGLLLERDPVNRNRCSRTKIRRPGADTPPRPVPGSARTPAW